MIRLYKKYIGYEARKKIGIFWGLCKECRNKKQIYFRMPKVASGTIVEALNDETVIVPHSYKPKTINNLLKINSNAIKFTFVRHPLDRFVSAYNWAVRDDISPEEYPLDIIQRNIIDQFEGINDFCRNLPTLLKSNTNHLIHFYPQTYYIKPYDELLVDFVGKYEDMTDSCLILKKKYGIDLSIEFGDNLKNKNKKRTNKEPIKVLSEMGVSTKNVKLLKEIYSKDFVTFGYY
ncbi:sulfotransferase family 2 domain-containing protein [Cognaticolwellia beringensis]|uniref:Sulfotransferase n=1 Tax=Cognaticolwellia beringensis TaxID=1967665 RepID=A0A222G7W8_9GAMM|nr:sulfotransferase family 2 domain-containing protein [Cognaticolwellia beringensis]ASP47985.1 hypothetical protein B5D82_09580 [Cognaticolwellia beringensis]